MVITKRDGTKEEFSRFKIKQAISDAFCACNSCIDDEDIDDLMDDVQIWDEETVEEIQSQIIEVLSSCDSEVATAYIKYRAKKELAREQIAKVQNYIDSYTSSKSNAATASNTDDNANVTMKNVANLDSELPKSDNRDIQRAFMKMELNKLYPGTGLGKQYQYDLQSHIIYPHDEASKRIPENYCEAVGLYPLVLNGSSTLDNVGTQTPTHLQSFCGQLVNATFLLAGQCKGAVACLYKDQPLIINNKQIKIKDFVKNNWHSPESDDKWEYCRLSGNDTILEDGKSVSIKKVFRKKYSDKIYRIKSNKGFIATTSKDHKFKVLRKGNIEEITAENLELFDTVFVNNDVPVDFSSNDYQRGWIKGMLLGDGCLTQLPSVSLSVNYEQKFYGDIFNDYSAQQYGNTLSLCSGHKCFNYERRNKEYAENLTKDLIGDNTYNKHLEQSPSNYSVNFLVGILDGLLSADGCDNHSIVLSLANETLIENIKEILDILRINYTYKIVPEHDNKHALYHLTISSQVIKYTPHFNKKLRGNKRVTDLYYFSGKARKGSRRDPNYILATTKDHFIHSEYKLDVITNIETIDNDDDYVYEIETESHWYNCGGFITHNCGEFFNFLDYYCVLDYGENYPEKENLSADSSYVINQQTIGKKIENAFEQIVYNWNQPAGNRGHQSPFTNISYYDSNYWKALFEDFIFPDGSKPKWERVDYLQKKFMKWFNKERTRTLLTFPVETMALLSDGKDIIDQDYKNFTAEMYSEGHSFFTYISSNPNAIASCCRLRNEIQENVFSFTNGLTGVQTGSCNVITLNINRILQNYFINFRTTRYDKNGENLSVKRKQDWSSQWYKEHREKFAHDFAEYLNEQLERIYKYHIAYKTMLYDFESKGMMTASSAGYISMQKLYSTIGINGINEAAMFLGMKVSDNKEYCDFCNLITSTISKANKEHSTAKFLFNTEFVPAESLGAKNYNWDKEDGYWVPDDRNLYNSYFYDAHDDTSILEKLRMHGARFTKNLDGGCGCHLNLSEHLSKSQYLKLIDYAIEQGTTYFTFNIPNTQCDKCHTIYKQPLTKCPKCGSEQMTQWTRIIGYLRPIKAFSKPRFVEAMNRTYKTI